MSEKIKTCNVSGKRCVWWRPLSGKSATGYCCHYCVITGKARARDENGKCLSVRTTPLNAGWRNIIIGFRREGVE